MLNELKILFNNIKNFRRLITENVNDNDILDAIQNHEYVYIYYKGDGENQSGYRTIRPYVLGTSSAGNKVIRAWQDRGRSKSLSADSPRKRYEHEYWTDTDGKEKAGWRLFRLDRISSMYPTGKKFIDNNGNVLIPPKYQEGSDRQMSNIIAYVSSKTPELQTKGLKSIEEPDVVAGKTDKSELPDTERSRYSRFFNANKTNRKESLNDIKKLYDIAKRVMKKSPNRYLVVINDKNEYELMDVKNRDYVPKNAIVGDLTNLYDRLVKPEVSEPEKEKFFNDTLNKTKQDINKTFSK